MEVGKCEWETRIILLNVIAGGQLGEKSLKCILITERYMEVLRPVH